MIQPINAIRRLRMGIRLGIGYGIIFLVTITGFYFVTVKMEKMSLNSENFYNHPFTVSNAINAAEINVLNISRTSLHLCLDYDLKDIKEARTRIDSLTQKLATAMDIVHQQYLGPKSDVENVQRLLAEWEPMRAEILDLKKQGKSSDAINILMNKAYPKVNQIIGALSVIRTFAADKAFTFMKDTTVEAKSGIHSLYSIIAFIAALSLLIAYLITISILGPVNKLIHVSKSISEGELGNTIESGYRDEIGELSEAFKKMQSGMAEKARQAGAIADGKLNIRMELLSEKDEMGKAFQRMTEKLRAHLGQIEHGINVLSSSSSEITASVTQLASTSIETVTSVSETATTVAEVKQTAEHVFAKAQEVSANAVKTANFSKEGIKAVENSIEGMDRIREHMEMIASAVVQLNEQRQIIGDIASTVVELAEQSNLLSVNAAIEAAKAGEQGKGFSIVAREIKNLANRSKESANQVRVILRDVQKSINAAVTATEEGNKSVKEGLQLSTISGETINILSESMNDAVNAAVQIAASSRQQLEGMDQISYAMENVKESTVQASTSTKQSVDSIREIQSIGESLKELINQYAIK